MDLSRYRGLVEKIFSIVLYSSRTLGLSSSWRSKSFSSDKVSVSKIYRASLNYSDLVRLRYTYGISEFIGVTGIPICQFFFNPFGIDLYGPLTEPTWRNFQGCHSQNVMLREEGWGCRPPIISLTIVKS